MTSAADSSRQQARPGGLRWAVDVWRDLDSENRWSQRAVVAGYLALVVVLYWAGTTSAQRRMNYD